MVEENIKQLGALFAEMVHNDTTFASQWRNIPLGHEAFALLTDSLPLRYEGELTPYTRIVLLNNMLGCMPERDCARFILRVRDYQLSLFPLIEKCDEKEDRDIDGVDASDEEWQRAVTPEQIRQLRQRTADYIAMPMEKWCKKYNVILRFDPVEQTERWEEVIYDVEVECARRLQGTPVRMGYCFEAWSVRADVLAEYGIEWQNPHLMNPRVMFD